MLLLTMALLLGGCAAPETAPTELEDLIGWMFAHLDDDDPDAIVEGSTTLDGWMNDNLDQTLEGYEVTVLDDETIATLGVDERDLDGLQGVAVGYEHTKDLGELADAVMQDPEELHPDLYVEYDYEAIDGTKECFADGSCNRLEITCHALENLGMGIQLDISSQLQFRRYDTPDGPAFAYRYWTTEPPTVTTDLFSLDQSYFFWAFVPHGDVIRSMQASWVVVTVLADDLDSDIVLNLWVDGMIKGAKDLDEREE